MIEYHFVEQGSDQWLADREGRYTGSNAYKLLTSFGLTEWAKTKDSGFKGSFWTRRGNMLEDEAIDLYQRITKSVGIRNDEGMKVGYVTNTKLPMCLYSPDDIYPDITIEVKCFDEPQHMQLINAKTEHDIPLKIRAQIQYGLMVCERKSAILIAYNPKMADPKQAFKRIEIKANRNTANNFKRILSNEKAMV